MSLDISQFNTKIQFDDNLHDIAENPIEMQLACLEIEKHLKIPLKPLERASCLAQLGSLLRILKKLSDAEKCHKECLDLLLANHASSDRVLAAKIRLSHVYQWQRRFKESSSLFGECLVALKTQGNEELLGFCLQHQGKNLFDQGLFNEALGYFKEAFLIREKHQNIELMESSKLSITETLKRISKA